MSNLADFFKSRIFFINLAIALALLSGIYFGADRLLEWYTRHGEFIALPDLTKKPLNEAEGLLKLKGLNYVIIDSTYDEKLPPRTVINQVPYIGAHVKKGRNIYLYITSAVAPMVELPANGVIDAPLASAKLILERDGIKISGTQSKVDICVGCVLSVLYKGKPLLPGDKLQVGSKVTLVLGKDVNDNN